MVKKCKLYQNKVSQGSLAPWDVTKKFVWGGWDLAVFGNLPGGW